MTDQVTIEDFLREADPQSDMLGSLLLSILPCQDVTESALSHLPTFAGVRFSQSFDSFPATLERQLVASVWRLPAGQHRLDLGLLEAVGDDPIAAASAMVQLDGAQTYTWLCTLNTEIARPGLYRLVGRCNERILGAVAFSIEEARE